ncbi:MAG: hypothetical protein NVS1B3_17260 [Candidatus Dormibacteraceae bacterium]
MNSLSLARRSARWVLAIIALAAGGSFAASMSVVTQTKNDISAPLSTLVGSTKAPLATDHQTPVAKATGPLLDSGQADPVARATSGTLNAATLGLAFDGQSADDNRALLGGGAYVPPDTNGAVGSTQFVQTVNVTFAVYDKSTGKLELGPALLTDLWAGFGGLCETQEGGDPVVLYDQLAGRWIISQLAYNGSLTDNNQCIAVSETADATGRYHRYSFPFGSNLNDYPKFGVWPDAYYYSANMYAVAGAFKFSGALACAYDRAAMLRGKPAAAICFQNPPTVASLLPANLDGSTLPPTGAPETFVGLADATDLNVFHLHADFEQPGNSTFAGITLPVAPFKEICARATDLACIPQPTPGEHVDGLGDRLMFRLAYRNFGDHESLVANHTVAGGPLAAVRWYEIRNPTTAPFVYQQGTVVDPVNNYWLGSIAMDKAGDIALGFSASSTSLFPSILAVGRQPGDPLGTMRGPLVLQPGGGVQLPNSYRRWGDYSSMAIDPADDCTFWYTQEFYKATGIINWATRVSSFKFAGCQ